MTYRELARHARTGAGWSAAALGFAIPISTALDSLLMALVVLAWIVAAPQHFRETLRGYAEAKSMLLALALFLALLASCAWSLADPKAAWSAALKYVDLALIPAFVWAARGPGVLRWAAIGFMLAIVLNLIVSYGSALHAWEALPGLRTFPWYPIGFRLSVTHNFLLSLAAFGLLLLARELRATSPRVAIVALAVALACIYNVLFVVFGRTGYVVIAALLVYFAVSITRERRSVLVAALMMTVLFGGAYLTSTAFSSRIQDVASDLVSWKPGAADETSVGQRLGFYRTSAAIVAEHPVAGVGAGGVASAYAAKVRGTQAPTTSNVHNDYLMIAAQAGLPAAALLVWLYVALWREAPKLGSALARDLMRGVVLAFAIAGLFNSFLLDHVEGLLFAWSVGLLYASRDATAVPGARAA